MEKVFCEDLVAGVYSSYHPWPQRAQFLPVRSHRSAGLGERS